MVLTTTSKLVLEVTQAILALNARQKTIIVIQSFVAAPLALKSVLSVVIVKESIMSVVELILMEASHS